jgi:hypothetical protein
MMGLSKVTKSAKPGSLFGPRLSHQPATSQDLLDLRPKTPSPFSTLARPLMPLDLFDNQATLVGIEHLQLGPSVDSLVQDCGFVVHLLVLKA